MHTQCTIWRQQRQRKFSIFFKKAFIERVDRRQRVTIQSSRLPGWGRFTIDENISSVRHGGAGQAEVLG